MRIKIRHNLKQILQLSSLNENETSLFKDGFLLKKNPLGMTMNTGYIRAKWQNAKPFFSLLKQFLMYWH